MNHEQRSIATGSMVFINPYWNGIILSASASMEANDHARMNIELSLQEPPRLEIAPYMEPVQLDAGLEVPLFAGRIESAKVMVEGDQYLLHATIVSGTIALDRENTRQRRSFQDGSMQYRDVFQTVLDPYPEAVCIYPRVDQHQPTGQLLIQYDETDWEFLKRVASHMKAALYPSVRSSDEWLSVGPSSPWRKFECESMASNCTRVISEGGTGYEVVSDQFLELGDTIMIDGREYCVTQVSWELVGQVVQFTCFAAGRLDAPQYCNRLIQGATLSGTVRERRDQMLEIDLDIDNGASHNTYTAFPWVPDTASIMYAMPEVGETVNVRISTTDEATAAAVDCPREHPNRRRSYVPKTKDLTTKEGTLLALHNGDSITMAQSGEDPSYILRLDKEGISARTTTRLRMQAHRNVVIKAPVVKGFGVDRVELLDRSTNRFVLLQDELHVSAARVLPESLSQEPAPEEQGEKHALSMQAEAFAVSSMARQHSAPLFADLTSIDHTISFASYRMAAAALATTPKTMHNSETIVLGKQVTRKATRLAEKKRSHVKPKRPTFHYVFAIGSPYYGQQEYEIEKQWDPEKVEYFGEDDVVVKKCIRCISDLVEYWNSMGKHQQLVEKHTFKADEYKEIDVDIGIVILLTHGINFAGDASAMYITKQSHGTDKGRKESNKDLFEKDAEIYKTITGYMVSDSGSVKEVETLVFSGKDYDLLQHKRIDTLLNLSCHSGDLNVDTNIMTELLKRNTVKYAMGVDGVSVMSPIGNFNAGNGIIYTAKSEYQQLSNGKLGLLHKSQGYINYTSGTGKRIGKEGKHRSDGIITFMDWTRGKVDDARKLADVKKPKD